MRATQTEKSLADDVLVDDIFGNGIKPFKDEIIEKAYMGEHVNIQPPETQRKRLTLHEQIFYEYIKSHPNYTMPGTCRDLKMSQCDYIKMKQRIAEKGWPISGVIQTKRLTNEETENVGDQDV